MRGVEAGAAVEAYHGLLRSGPAEEAHAALLAAQEARGLVYGGRLACDVLRPCLLQAAACEEVLRGAELVARGLAAVVEATRCDAALREAIGLGPVAGALLRIEGGAPTPSVVGRLDGLVDEAGRARFIEYNPSPGGIAQGDELAEVFLELPPMKELSARWPMEAPSLRAALLGALSRREAGGGAAGLPSLGVFGGAMKNAAELQQLLGYLVNAGAVVAPPCDAAAWSFDGGALRAGGTPVEVVVFVHPDHVAALLARGGEDHAIFRAVRAGAARALNGLYASEVLYSKALLAILSDPAHAGLFAPEVAAALGRWVPWTRVLRAGPAILDGREVDLAGHALEQQEALVLKPARGFGGEGVVLGAGCTKEEWRAALAAALEGPSLFVAQERVRAPAEPWPVLRDGALELTPRFADLSPFVWSGGVAAGCSVRVGRDPVINLARGASAVPAFVLRGEPEA